MEDLLKSKEGYRTYPKISSMHDGGAIEPYRSPSLSLNRKGSIMKISKPLLCVFAAATLFVTQASAKGCLTGAAVGGTAGHFAGKHGVVGAGVGCAVGRHRANKKDRAAAAAQPAAATAAPAATPAPAAAALATK